MTKRLNSIPWTKTSPTEKHIQASGHTVTKKKAMSALQPEPRAKEVHIRRTNIPP